MLSARSFHSDRTRPAQQAQDQEQSLPDQDHDQNHIVLDWERSCNKTSLRPHKWFIVFYSCSASAVQCAREIGQWTLRGLYSIVG